MEETADISYEDFEKVEIRVGEIIRAEIFKEARTPAYIVEVNFGGSIGVKKSSAQLTKNYVTSDLVGRRVAAVTNFPKKQIGPMQSEILILGFPDDDGQPVLVSPDKKVPLGGRLF